MGKKILLMGSIFLVGTVLSLPRDFSIGLRRIRQESVASLIQELKAGDVKEVARVFQDGTYEIHLQGKYLSPASTTGEFSYPHVFLSIQVYENGQKIGYLCIFPTSKGYRAVSSIREQKGEPLYQGNFATHMMEMARESFGIERDLGWEKVVEFNPKSFDQLPAFLAYYYYNQISSQSPDLSLLEKFIFTVDAVKEETEVSPEKIADILSQPVYGCGNFSKLGLYYRIVKQYPGKGRGFFSALREIKEESLRAGVSQREIERKLIDQVRSNIEYKLSDAELLELLYAAGILSWRDQLLTIGDRISFASDTLLSFSEARDKIISDVKDGKLGWLGVVDLDQLRKINGIFGKQVVDFILKDIKRAFNYFLGQVSGIAFAYRSGDEIGVYIPEGEVRRSQEVIENITNYLTTLRYGVFYVESEYILPEELRTIEDIFKKYDAFISSSKYGGHQLGIMRWEGGDVRLKIRQMFNEISERLGRSFSFRFYLGDVIKEGFAPTFSGGLVDIKKLALTGELSPEKIFTQACYRAQDTLLYAKSRGKNNVIIGYRKEYKHRHTGESLLTAKFRTQIDNIDSYSPLRDDQSSKLTPGIYNEQSFRKVVYEYLKHPGNGDGLLLWISPRYNEGQGLHDINEMYTLQGGDDIIRTLAYFLKRRLKAMGWNEAMIGRRIDRFFVFLPGLAPGNINYERILEIFSALQHDFEKEISEVSVSFDIYGAFSSPSVLLEPGQIFQQVMYAEREAKPICVDLWGNKLAIFGKSSEDVAARVEQKLAEESVSTLVVEILTQRILPNVHTIEDIKHAVDNDAVLRHISWDFIYRILEEEGFLSHQESFLSCFVSAPC